MTDPAVRPSGVRVHPLRWLGQRDRGFAALRRATRAAIIMPAIFVLGDKVIGNPQLATFAAFGSFAMPPSPRPATSSSRWFPARGHGRYSRLRDSRVPCPHPAHPRGRSRAVHARGAGRAAVRRRLGHPRGRGDPRQPFPGRPARDRAAARSGPFSRPAARRDRRLHALREGCDRWGAYLVLDEVICGFGRLGQWQGSQNFGVRPDLGTFVKAVTSGYLPLGGEGTPMWTECSAYGTMGLPGWLPVILGRPMRLVPLQTPVVPSFSRERLLTGRSRWHSRALLRLSLTGAG